jgi:hypothetical protein
VGADGAAVGVAAAPPQLVSTRDRISINALKEPVVSRLLLRIEGNLLVNDNPPIGHQQHAKYASFLVD